MCHVLCAMSASVKPASGSASTPRIMVALFSMKRQFHWLPWTGVPWLKLYCLFGWVVGWLDNCFVCLFVWLVWLVVLLFGCLFVCLVGWLVGWAGLGWVGWVGGSWLVGLVGWLVWLFGCFMIWLFVCLVGWSVWFWVGLGWVACLLACLLACLVGWLVGWLVAFLILMLRAGGSQETTNRAVETLPDSHLKLQVSEVLKYLLDCWISFSCRCQGVFLSVRPLIEDGRMAGDRDITLPDENGGQRQKPTSESAEPFFDPVEFSRMCFA